MTSKNRCSSVATAGSVSEVINDYWTAIEAWRAADRKKRRLAKKLHPDVIREPRVLTGYLIRSDGRVPIYAHNSFQIEGNLEGHFSAYLSFASSRQRKQRVRSTFRKRIKELIAALEDDRAALYKEQRALGWRQAVEEEERARWAVYDARKAAVDALPGTAADALALIEFVRDATDLNNRRQIEGAPYGLGEHYTRAILNRVVCVLQGQPRNRLKIAA